MAEPASRISGTQALRPRARILHTLGNELTSSETVAVIELVKNAYDADATRVLVRFQGPLEIGQGRIEVMDNGHGMSLETIQTTWMEPATLFRKRQQRSEQYGRRVLGEKGIGRFAASRLANHLEVVTRRAGADREIRALFDWSQFDDEHKYLDEVEVLWEESEPAEICPGGIIQALWRGEKTPEGSALTHGTILRMEGLRAIWGESQLERLHTGLARLVSPFFEQDRLTGHDTFQIYLELPEQFAPLSGIIEPPEALKSPHYTITGHIDDTGHYTLTLRLPAQDHQEYVTGQFSLPDRHTPQCGPFSIELRVWDRDSLSGLAHERGATIADVRRDLDAAAGINIYRDGFRVLPYGEPHNDWLRLDLRRVQNPTMRLSNNQIMGYVLISADKNPQLRDQSNREGLIEGPALDDLRELVKMVLAELEKRRYTIRRQSATSQQAAPAGGLFTDVDLTDISALIRKQYPDDARLLDLVEERERELEMRVKVVQEVLARYRRLATLGQLIDTVLHDGRAPLAKIGNEAHLGQRDLERTRTGNDNLLSRLSQRFGTINTQTGVLTAIFRKIEPFGGRKRGRPAQVRLEQVIADAFAVLETEIAAVGAQVGLPETDTQVTVDQTEIQEVIVNLLQNSLYWLRQVPQEHRKVAVCVRRNSADEVEIVFSDSGPGVEASYRDCIFDPYFSTRPQGVGLGLTILWRDYQRILCRCTGVTGQWSSTRCHLSHHTAYTGMTWLPPSGNYCLSMTIPISVGRCKNF
jgi:signal transduction histidine kinase